jgi:hypothetical protein
MNPFSRETDPDRHYIWERLIVVDSEAFAKGDWAMIENDFDADHFEGIRCNEAADPDDWTLAFPRLEDYRDSWIAASKQFATKKFAGVSHLQALLQRAQLTRIDLAGHRALAHKTFSGEVPLADGAMLCGDRQTLYRLHRRDGRWRIVGFLGQLPLATKP